MDMATHGQTVALGFMVWLGMAPRLGNPRYAERFLAYMATLMVCLVGTSEVMLTEPIPFFFTVGGTLAFLYILVRTVVKVAAQRE